MTSILMWDSNFLSWRVVHVWNKVVDLDLYEDCGICFLNVVDFVCCVFCMCCCIHS